MIDSWFNNIIIRIHETFYDCMLTMENFKIIAIVEG